MNGTTFPIAAGTTEIDQGTYAPDEVSQITLVGVSTSENLTVSNIEGDDIPFTMSESGDNIVLSFEQDYWIRIQWYDNGILWRVVVGT